MTTHLFKQEWRDAAKLPNIHRNDDDLWIEHPSFLEGKLVPGDTVRIEIHGIPDGYRVHVAGQDGEIVQRFAGNLVVQYPVVPPCDECEHQEEYEEDDD